MMASALGDDSMRDGSALARNATASSRPVCQWGVLPKSRAYAPLKDPAHLCQLAFERMHDAIRGFTLYESIQKQSATKSVPEPVSVPTRVVEPVEEEEEEEEDGEPEAPAKSGSKKAKQARANKEKPVLESPVIVAKRARLARGVWDPYWHQGPVPDVLSTMRSSLSSIKIDVLRALSQRPMALRRKEYRDLLFRRILAPNQLPHAIMHTVSDSASLVTCCDASHHATQFASGCIDGRVLVWRVDRRPHGAQAGSSAEDAVEDRLLPPSPYTGVAGAQAVPGGPSVLEHITKSLPQDVLHFVTGQLAAELAREATEGADFEPAPITTSPPPPEAVTAHVPGRALREALRKLHRGEHRPADEGVAAATVSAPGAGTGTAAGSGPASGEPSDPAVPLSLVGHGARVTCVALSPDDTACLSCAADGSVIVWDLKFGEVATQFSGHGAAAWCGAWSPAGRFCATGGADGAIRIWDPSYVVPYAVLPLRCGSVTALAFHPNAGVMAVGAADGVVRVVRTPDAGGRPSTVLWEGTHSSGEPLRPVVDFESKGSHRSMVTAVAWREDGMMLATGDLDGRVVLWNMDAEKGKVQEATFALHSDAVWSLSFSACGTQLAAGSMDGTVSLWHIHPFSLRHAMDRQVSYVVAGVDQQRTSRRESELRERGAMINAVEQEEGRGGAADVRRAGQRSGNRDMYPERGPVSELDGNYRADSREGRPVIARHTPEYASSSTAEGGNGGNSAEDLSKLEAARDRLLRIEHILRVEAEEPGTTARALALESSYEVGAVHVLAGTAHLPVAPRRPTVMLELEAVAAAMGLCPDAARKQEAVRVVKGETPVPFPHLSPAALHFVTRAVGGEASVLHDLKLCEALKGSGMEGRLFRGPSPPFDPAVQRACATLRDAQALQRCVQSCRRSESRNAGPEAQSVLGIIGRAFASVSADLGRQQRDVAGTVAAGSADASGPAGPQLPPPTRSAFLDETLHDDSEVTDAGAPTRPEAPFLLRRFRTRDTPVLAVCFTARNLLTTVGVLRSEA